MPDIPLDDGSSTNAGLKLRESDLSKHLSETNPAPQVEDKAQAAAKATIKYQFTPAPRPKEVDEKLLRPETGDIVSPNDYELNQALAYLKSKY